MTKLSAKEGILILSILGMILAQYIWKYIRRTMKKKDYKLYKKHEKAIATGEVTTLACSVLLVVLILLFL